MTRAEVKAGTSVNEAPPYRPRFICGTSTSKSPGDDMTTELSKVEARQGETLGRMRYVLAGSLAFAIAALVFAAWTVAS